VVTPERGEVWWVESPDEARRPYLVLTRSEAIPVLQRLIVVPLTRTIRGIPTEVPLDESDGLMAPCVVSLDNIRTHRRSHLVERIAVLEPERMDQVCRALHLATAC
jgi:mRNA interferase MazF